MRGGHVHFDTPGGTKMKQNPLRGEKEYFIRNYGDKELFFTVCVNAGAWNRTNNSKKYFIRNYKIKKLFYKIS